jgi:hypothetical protein
MKKKYIKKEKYDEKRKKIKKGKIIINIIKLPCSLATFGNFKRISRSRPILIFTTMCNPITKTSFVPRDHPLPFAHVHLSKKSVFFSSPNVEHYFPKTCLTSHGKSMRSLSFLIIYQL